jgi:hypothetical protein
MKHLARILVVGGILIVGAAFADTLKNAKVDGGVVTAQDKAFTIDTSTPKGQELASKSGTFDVTGKVDRKMMKIVVENYKPVSSTSPSTTNPNPPADSPSTDTKY